MWIFDNALGNMRGPEFLVFYALVIVTVWVVSYVRCRGVDTTDRDDPLPIPKSPNPHEIALLRGGVNELARTLIAVLIDAGLVEIKRAETKWGRTSDQLQRTDANASRVAPNSIEAKALGYFDFPRSPAQVFQAGGLCDRIAADAAAIEHELREKQLLTTATMRSVATWRALQGFLVIAGLGIYKFAAAMDHGRHNVAFLIIGGILGSFALIPIGELPRLTRRGSQHLERLRMAFGSLRVRRADEDPAIRGSTVALAASLFGVVAVGGIAEAEMKRAFARANAHGNASSCGAGVGCGAATTASSCGGGGGGCGGGGCGGGGCGGCGGS